MADPLHSQGSFSQRLAWRRDELGRFHLCLALITTVGIVFRVAYVLVAKREFDSCGPPPAPLCGDAFYYSSSANVFAFGYGFENRLGGPGHFFQAADHPPLTTILMAPTNVFFWRQSAVAQRLGMCVLGGLVIVLVGLLARRLAGDRAGLLAAGLAAANANFWMNDVLVMSETVGTLCLVALLVVTYRFIGAPSWGGAAWMGLAVGIAGLARAELLLFGPLLVVPACLLARSQAVPRRMGLIALAGLCAVGALAPWTLYNLSRFDEPVFLSTNDGLTLIGANCDRVYGVVDPGGVGFWNLGCRFDADARYGIPGRGDQSTQAGEYRRIALDYIASHKSLLPKIAAIRVARASGFYAPAEMVWLNQGEGRDSWASWTGYVTWWLSLVPAAVGVRALHATRRVPVWPLLMSIPVVVITAIAFYGIVRFRLPADLAATSLAGVGIDASWRRLTSRRL